MSATDLNAAHRGYPRRARTEQPRTHTVLDIALTLPSSPTVGAIFRMLDEACREQLGLRQVLTDSHFLVHPRPQLRALGIDPTVGSQPWSPGDRPTSAGGSGQVSRWSTARSRPVPRCADVSEPTQRETFTLRLMARNSECNCRTRSAEECLRKHRTCGSVPAPGCAGALSHGTDDLP